MQLYLQNYLKEVPDGRSSIKRFHGYVTKKFLLHQTLKGLSLYDGAGLVYHKMYYLELILLIFRLHCSSEVILISRPAPDW